MDASIFAFSPMRDQAVGFFGHQLRPGWAYGVRYDRVSKDLQDHYPDAVFKIRVKTKVRIWDIFDADQRASYLSQNTWCVYGRNGFFLIARNTLTEIFQKTERQKCLRNKLQAPKPLRLHWSERKGAQPDQTVPKGEYFGEKGNLLGSIEGEHVKVFRLDGRHLAEISCADYEEMHCEWYTAWLYDSYLMKRIDEIKGGGMMFSGKALGFFKDRLLLKAASYSPYWQEWMMMDFSVVPRSDRFLNARNHTGRPRFPRDRK